MQLECCIIMKMIPFNDTMDVYYDENSAFKVSFSRKNVKSFSKEPFLS